MTTSRSETNEKPKVKKMSLYIKSIWKINELMPAGVAGV